MFFGLLAIYSKEGVEEGGEERGVSELDLRRIYLGFKGGSGILGCRIIRRMISYSGPSGEVVLLSSLTLASYVFGNFLRLCFVRSPCIRRVGMVGG